MRLTKESEYALRGLAILAISPSGSFASPAEIADAQNLPPSFLAKIFQKLARHGLLTAGRGPGSGYALARPPASITVRQILESVEGPELFQHCILWSGHNEENPCPLHEHVKAYLPMLTARLEAITLAEYATTRTSTPVSRDLV
jgi:Rrf2 family protein